MLAVLESRLSNVKILLFKIDAIGPAKHLEEATQMFCQG